MRCPKCDGGGQVWNYQEGPATDRYSSTCPSCGGLGYIPDTINYLQSPIGGEVKAWIKCPHCEKQIKVSEFQYHTVVASPL